MSGMRFDSTINLGHVMTIVAMLIGGTAAYTRIQVDITELKTIVKGYQAELNDHEMRLRELERRTRD